MPGESRDRLPRRDHLTVFLLDIAGTRTPQQEESRRQILMRIEALPPGDRFNVVAFNSRVLPYASSPLAPNPETIASIRSWMDVLPQEAGSDLPAGLQHALAQEDVTSVILFSDGNSLRSLSSQTELLAFLQRENRSYARIMAVAPELPAQQQQAGRAVSDVLLERARSEGQTLERPGGAELP